MKVLIVGSGGYIGQHLLKYLQTQGIDVLGVSSSDSNGISPLTGTLSDRFSIPPETHTVIYLSQSPFYRQVPEKAGHLLNVNVVSAVQVAEMARQAKVKRFIYTSTGNVYAPSFSSLGEASPLNRSNWYALSKIHAEEALSMFKNDMDITIVRLFGVYGGGQTDKLVPNLFNSISQGNKIFVDRNPQDLSDLDGLKISLIYIEDLIRIIAQCIYTEKTGMGTINVSSNEIVSIRSIVEHVSNILKKSVEIEVREQYRTFNLIADIQRLQKTFNPIFTPFEEGVKMVIAQYLEIAVKNKLLELQSEYK
ncbi:NAD-dependent epimerase/dehydratase [Tumidithrix helvetica PCC 7403]|uniref:NAD-dependent epimerase/dehydratase family protein n=1 Tax=Tumidithrix helvetica TaxID=3457545 RepID=UPI003C8775D8